MARARERSGTWIRLEREYILLTLGDAQAHQGNTAELLGINRRTPLPEAEALPGGEPPSRGEGAERAGGSEPQHGPLRLPPPDRPASLRRRLKGIQCPTRSQQRGVHQPCILDPWQGDAGLSRPHMAPPRIPPHP